MGKTNRAPDGFNCKKCGHRWRPRESKSPMACPRCRSPSSNRATARTSKPRFSARKNKVLFTLGYEGLTPQQFVEKLKAKGIKQLIDVRQLALSRKRGFSKSALERVLKKEGIRYQHFSLLGTPKALRDKLHADWDYRYFFKEYRKRFHDPGVLKALKALQGLSMERKTALMCFEKDPSKCHRSILKEKFVKKGFKVIDL